MRFCTDHSVHGALVRALETTGVDIVSARLLGPHATDADILAFANHQDRVLIAQDSDFGALVFLQGRACVGVVSIRFRIQSATQATDTARRILALPQGGRGAFTTLDASGERQRPLL